MNWLRKRMIWGVAAVAALSLPIAAACGGDDDDDADTTPQASVTQGTEDVGTVLGDLTIKGGWVRTTANDVTAAYMVIENEGLEDALVAASSPIAPMVQLHEVITEGSSTKMQEKEGGFTVPAQGMVELKPGGFHIMMMNLTDPLEEGDEVDVTLTFEEAGEVTVTLPVQRGEGGSMDMSGH